MEVFQVTDTTGKKYSHTDKKLLQDHCSLFSAQLATIDNLLDAAKEGKIRTKLSIIDKPDNIFRPENETVPAAANRYSIIDRKNAFSYVEKKNSNYILHGGIRKLSEDEINKLAPVLVQSDSGTSDNFLCYGVKPCEHTKQHSNFVVQSANKSTWSVHKNPKCHTGLTTIELVLVIIAALLIVGLLGSLVYKRFNKN